MADDDQGQEPGQGQGQEPTSSTDQQQQPAGQGGGAQGQEPGGESGQFDLSGLPEETRAYVERIQRDAAEARREAAKYRTERNSLHTEVEKARQATMTDEQKREAEAERLRQENAALKDRLQTQALTTAATREASSLRFHDPAVALRLIDKSKIEYDDDGQPTNLRELLEAEAKAAPYLIKRSGGGGGGEGRERQQTGGMNDLMRRAVGRT